MRRFLDGFYPMQVSLEIHYPEQFRLQEISPPPQPGFRLRQQQGRIELDGWFEGKLTTRIIFR
jgi:hypothetical protein